MEGKDGRRVASLPENDTGIAGRCNASQAREPPDSLGRYFTSSAALLEISAEVEVATHREDELMPAPDRSAQAYVKVDELLQMLVSDPYQRTELAFAIITYGTAKAWDAVDRKSWSEALSDMEREVTGDDVNVLEIVGSLR